MTTLPQSPNRRSLLVTSASASAVSLLPAQFAAAAVGDAIRPFRINVLEFGARRSAPAPGGDPVARSGDRRRSVANS